MMEQKKTENQAALPAIFHPVGFRPHVPTTLDRMLDTLYTFRDSARVYRISSASHNVTHLCTHRDGPDLGAVDKRQDTRPKAVEEVPDKDEDTLWPGCSVEPKHAVCSPNDVGCLIWQSGQDRDSEQGEQHAPHANEPHGATTVALTEAHAHDRADADCPVLSHVHRKGVLRAQTPADKQEDPAAPTLTRLQKSTRPTATRIRKTAETPRSHMRSRSVAGPPP